MNTKNSLTKINAQVNPAALFFFLGIIIFSSVIGFNVSRYSPLIVMGILGGIAVGLITLVNVNLGLVILIFSMLWSPEIPIAQTVERAVMLRVDDFLIITVFFTWLAKMAVRKELGLLRRTPLNGAIFAYLAANIFSTLLGILSDDVKPAVGMFYNLKFIEFFMLYFLFINNLNEMKQLKTFVFCFLLVAFTIGIFTYAQMGGAARPTAPFEGEHPEPNTLAGYLLLCICIIGGLFLNYKFSIAKVILGGLVCFNLLPIVRTLSRSSYIGLTVAYLALIFITKRGKILLAIMLVFTILFFPLVVPKVAIERILYTFTGQVKFQIGDFNVRLDGSAATRIHNYQFALEALKQKPFFGFGVTGLGLIDSQYARTLAELGIIGFFILCFLIFSIIKNTWQIYSHAQDDFSIGLSVGFLCGFIGLLVVGIGANIFVIVRISEPLWFLAACVMALPEIENMEPHGQAHSTFIYPDS